MYTTVITMRKANREMVVACNWSLIDSWIYIISTESRSIFRSFWVKVAVMDVLFNSFGPNPDPSSPTWGNVNMYRYTAVRTDTDCRAHLFQTTNRFNFAHSWLKLVADFRKWVYFANLSVWVQSQSLLCSHPISLSPPVITELFTHIWSWMLHCRAWL